MASGVADHAHAVVAVLERWREPKEWYELAACRGLGPALFFPSSTTPDPATVAICARCPVVQECAEAGQDELYGLWGGVLHTPGGRFHRSPLSRITRRYEEKRAPRDRRRGAA